MSAGGWSGLVYWRTLCGTACKPMCGHCSDGTLGTLGTLGRGGAGLTMPFAVSVVPSSPLLGPQGPRLPCAPSRTLPQSPAGIAVLFVFGTRHRHPTQIIPLLWQLHGDSAHPAWTDPVRHACAAAAAVAECVRQARGLSLSLSPIPQRLLLSSTECQHGQGRRMTVAARKRDQQPRTNIRVNPNLPQPNTTLYFSCS